MSRLWGEKKNEARLSSDTRLYLLSFEPCDSMPYENNLNFKKFSKKINIEHIMEHITTETDIKAAHSFHIQRQGWEHSI